MNDKLMELFESIKTYIDAKFASVKLPKDGKDGIDGIDGKDGISVSKEEIEELIAKEVQAITVPTPENGKDGKDGIDGKDGESVSLEEIEELIVSKVQAITVPTPENGKDGKDGKDGIDGKSVDIEELRALIIKEVSDIEIPEPIKGEKGEDGKDGKDGKDAVEINILDQLDEEKTYPFGVYASYNGGIIKSYRLTDPLKDRDDFQKCGWQIIVNGIASVQVKHLDDNSFSLEMVQTRGIVKEQFTLPIMVYKGVWEEAVYGKNESVTWGGSVWISETDNNRTKPGEEKSLWKLAVKKGRDGRDGLRGEKGDRGAQGKDGKNLN
jgi:hypothetical protein